MKMQMIRVKMQTKMIKMCESVVKMQVKSDENVRKKMKILATIFQM
jgi:hypothetical protein